jgi:hypothetical protein
MLHLSVARYSIENRYHRPNTIRKFPPRWKWSSAKLWRRIANYVTSTRLRYARDCKGWSDAPIPARRAVEGIIESVPSEPRARISKIIDSLAVLPFENANRDSEHEYLSDGIAGSLINILATIPKLRVMAQSTVLRYKGRGTDPQTLGRELKLSGGSPLMSAALAQTFAAAGRRARQSRYSNQAQSRKRDKFTSAGD